MAGYGLVPWVPAILALGLCEGAVAAIAFPTLDAYLASRADPRIQGRIQGVFSSSMMAGAATSALGGSVLYKIAPGLPFVIGGAVLAVVTIVAVGLIRGTGQPARPVTAPAPAPAAGECRRLTRFRFSSVRCRIAHGRRNDDDLPQPVSRHRDPGDRR